MHITTIAIGDRAHENASRLKQHVPDLIILTEAERRPEHVHENQAVSARLMKTGFASYLPLDTVGTVVLIDSDMQPAVTDPLAQMPEITSEIAGVAWSLRTFHPAPFSHIDPDFPALNSGLLVFRSVADAVTVSDAWHATYIDYLDCSRRDEPPLQLALLKLGLTPQLLPRQFNAHTHDFDTVFLHLVGGRSPFPLPKEKVGPTVILPTSFSVSKLAVRRKLREVGLENVLDGLLASNPTAAADWNDALELSTDDPLLTAMLPVFANSAGIPESEVLDMLRECL